MSDAQKVIDRLRELEKAADLDRLQSCHILNDGYTHLANLTEVINEDPTKGRGRVLAMTFHQWLDLLAASRNALPALLEVARALTKMAGQHGVDCGSQYYRFPDGPSRPCSCGKTEADAALDALGKVELP